METEINGSAESFVFSFPRIEPQLRPLPACPPMPSESGAQPTCPGLSRQLFYVQIHQVRLFNAQLVLLEPRVQFLGRNARDPRESAGQTTNV